jgi:hypothetical protein
MKYKIVFGIAIPTIIILLLVFLGSLNIGFSIDKTYVNQLAFQDIFTEDYQLRKSIKIADITVDNDYFLGKRYELPRLGICLDDKEGNLARLNAGNLQYSEGEYNYNSNDFIFSESSYRSYPYYYGGRSEARNIEINANNKKIIRIFLQPSYEFNYLNYTQLLNKYGDYDSLLIFELSNNYNSYYYCNQLDQETLNKAIAIPIVK